MLKLTLLLLTWTLASLASTPGPLLESNRGQFRPDIQFRARNGGIATDIDASGLVFRSRDGLIRLQFDRGHAQSCTPLGTIESRSNYLAVTPPIVDVPSYSSVICRDIYPGIDWVVRSADGTMEHDWLVAAGQDAGAIAMRVNAGTTADCKSRWMAPGISTWRG